MSDAELHVMIIDDNPAIHQDFIKVLTTATANSEIDDLGQQLFDDELDLANPHQVDTDIALPRFIFDTAYQGKEGVEAIKRSLKQGIRYALAFVDIQMPPGWDGIETIKHMWDVDPDIQVVICTAYSDYTWEETVKELGIGDNYLILKKPFDLTAVRQLACALTRKWILAEAAKRTTERLQETIEQKTESLQQYVKERAKLARQLEYQASHDILTGLPNRTLLMDRIQHQIESSARYNRKFGVLFLIWIDLN